MNLIRSSERATQPADCFKHMISPEGADPALLRVQITVYPTHEHAVALAGLGRHAEPRSGADYLGRQEWVMRCGGKCFVQA